MFFDFFLVTLELTLELVNHAVDGGIHIVGFVRAFNGDALGNQRYFGGMPDFLFNRQYNLSIDRFVDVLFNPGYFFIQIRFKRFACFHVSKCHGNLHAVNLLINVFCRVSRLCAYRSYYQLYPAIRVALKTIVCAR